MYVCAKGEIPLHSGVLGGALGWRVGRIKLPYSKLSAVTKPRGWSFCCFHCGGKKKEVEVGVSLW